MSTKERLSAHDRKIGDVLFGQQCRFRVPRYQRPYAWELEQISQFWSDLSSTTEPFFLGSVILNTESADEDGFIDIIDGQQRFLTITILSAVLRDCVAPLDAERAKRFQRQDIMFEDRDGRTSARIIPSDTLSEFFSAHVQTSGASMDENIASTEEEERVRAAYRYLRDELMRTLQGRTTEDQIEKIDEIRRRIAQLLVIEIIISKEEDAYEIFEATNARGLELSVADLLKNLIFRNMPPGDDRDIAKEYWQELVANAETAETEMSKFIRYFWVSRYDFLAERKLFSKIKEKIRDWEQLLFDLHGDSELYAQLLDGSEEDFRGAYKDGAKIYRALVGLRTMRVSQCYVFLLSVLRNYERLGTNPARLFTLIERFTFHYSIVAKMPANRLDKLYSQFARELESVAGRACQGVDHRRVQTIFNSFESKLLAERPKKPVFEEGFNRLAYKSTEEGRALVKYVLLGINQYYANTDELSVNWDRVNIEHVLPQAPASEWGLTKKAIKPYVNLLGNLTLLSKRLNSKAQNAVVASKIVELRQSDLPMTKVLVELLESRGLAWNESSIRERQRRLAEIAYEGVWSLNS